MRAFSCSLLLLAACARPPGPGVPPTPLPLPPTTTTLTPPPPPLQHFSTNASGIALVYSASVQGYVEPCGCTGDPLGGIARFKAVIDEAHRAFGDRVMVVDAGDLLFEKATDNGAVDRCQAEARTELLVSTYARAGLVATTRGPLDEVRGSAFRAALLAKHAIPSLDHGQSLVVVRGGQRVLVVGVDDQDDPALVNVATQTPHAAVVVLAQMSFKDAVARAPQWPDVDVVIVGRAAEAPLPPRQVGHATVVSAGWQAQYAGVLTLELQGRVAGAPLLLKDQASVEARKKLLEVRLIEIDRLLANLPEGAQKQFQQERRDNFAKERASLAVAVAVVVSGTPAAAVVVQAIPLKRGMSEEPQAQQELASYERSIPTLVGECERGVTCPKPEAGVAVFVGANTCKACHAAAWQTWQQAVVDVTATNKDGTKTLQRSGHSQAWATLVKAGRDKDRSCVGCHSTGFDVVGGACTTTLLLAKELGGVQCESCHGPGSLHVQSGGAVSNIRRLVDESVCRGCHLPPHIQNTASFVYDERVQQLLGPGHQRRTAP